MNCLKIKVIATIQWNWKFSIKLGLFTIFGLCLNNGMAQVNDTIEISIQKNIYNKRNPVLIVKNDSGMIKVNSIFKGRDSLYKNYFFTIKKDTNKLTNFDSIYSKENNKYWLQLQKVFKKKYFSFIGLQFICIEKNNVKLYIKKRNGIHLYKKIKLCYRCSHSCIFPTRRRP
jgi:hypothetical protein